MNPKTHQLERWTGSAQGCMEVYLLSVTHFVQIKSISFPSNYLKIQGSLSPHFLSKINSIQILSLTLSFTVPRYACISLS
jgi:hypothetical protein